MPYFPADAILTANLTAQFRLDLEWVILAGILLGLVFLGGFIVARYKRWLVEQKTPPASMAIDDYRALLDQGLLDPEEFERIRRRLEE